MQALQDRVQLRCAAQSKKQDTATDAHNHMRNHRIVLCQGIVESLEGAHSHIYNLR